MKILGKFSEFQEILSNFEIYSQKGEIFLHARSDQVRSGPKISGQNGPDIRSDQVQQDQISLGQIRSDQVGSDLRSGQVRSDQMRADLRLGQIRSGQMKKDPPRSGSDPLKFHISEIITALILITINVRRFRVLMNIINIMAKPAIMFRFH